MSISFWDSSFRTRALKMRVKRVVEERGPLEDVRVVFSDVGKSLADSPEARRLTRDVHFGREVGSVHDLAEALESGISLQLLIDQSLEGAPAPFIAVRVGRPRGVEADRSFALLNLGDLVRLDEENFGLPIQESPDQPPCRRPVDMDAFARHPFHGRRFAL